MWGSAARIEGGLPERYVGPFPKQGGGIDAGKNKIGDAALLRVGGESRKHKTKDEASSGPRYRSKARLKRGLLIEKLCGQKKKRLLSEIKKE